MHIAIQTGVQNRLINRQETSHILLRNVLFEAYFQDEDDLYANWFYYILSLVLNTYSFRSVLVTYACTFPSGQGF